MSFFRRFSLFAFIFTLSAGLLRAATLSGQVKDDDKKPMAGVRVIIPALQRGTQTDQNGNYKLENVQPGEYAVEFTPVDYPPVTKQVDLSKGDATADVQVAEAPLPLAPITISAKPQPSSTLTTPASVSVVQGRQLDKQRSQSVISAIQDQPGVNMTGEGPTVVKPILRGLNAQEIVVAEDGVRSEALQWGNEHAPEIDSQGADRIEVMRGPNSLLYGSDALGGVISVTHPDLPNAALGADALSGKFTAGFDSVNNGAGQSAQVGGAQGDWGWRGNLSQSQAGNYHNPLEGQVPNTGNREVGQNGAVGVHKDWGGLSASYGHFYKRVELQNPGDPGFPNIPLDDLEFQVLHHDHGTVKASVNTAPARFDVIGGYDWIDRQEFDGPAAPTNPTALHWTQGNYTLDVKANLAPMGPFHGTVGVSGLQRVERSLGDTHLTPGYNGNGFAGYLVEDLPVGRFDFTAGVRADHNSFNVHQDDIIARPVAAQTLKYSATTGALGGVYHITDPLAFAVNVGRGYRNPVPFELFAFGVHEGEGVFSVGNPNLKPETSLNTDASLRWASRWIKAEAGVFRNNIDKYIYGAYADPSVVIPENVDGLPIVNEVQGKARIQGVDGSAAVAATDWLTFKAVYNLVRGTNESGDTTLPNKNLPHIPADNWLGGVDLHTRSLGKLANPYIGVDAKMTKAQNRTSPQEIASKGYTLWNVRMGTEIVVMNNRVALDAGVLNAGKKGYIDYNSLVKLSNIQNPGRNVFVKMSVPFGN